MIKYHDKSGGTTQRSLAKIHHVERLGKLYYVKGHTFHSRKHGGGSLDYTVVVRGENGYCSFEGFSHGYHGEGPNGLKILLTKLGISDTIAKEIAHKGAWLDAPGVDWVYNF